MTDRLLQEIEERLAERRRASLGPITDERREKARMSLVSRARNNDEDGKERLQKLLALFPQLSEWVAEQMALPPMEYVRSPAGDQKSLLRVCSDDFDKPLSANLDNASATPFESIREMTRRQVREAGDVLSPPTPEPPKPEWYESGQFNPGLNLADQLKRLFGPQAERGDGSWMRKR
jgi:hypothetical protein